jgi:hypothetical protein
MLIFGGVAVSAICLAFVPFAFAGEISDGAALIVLMVAAGALLGSAFSSLSMALTAVAEPKDPRKKR